MNLKELCCMNILVRFNIQNWQSQRKFIRLLPQGECGQEYPYRKWPGSEQINGRQILAGLTGTAVELDSLSDVRFDVEITSEHT